MKSIFEPENKREIMSRLESLAEKGERQWGKMTVGQMCCHMSDAMEIPLGKRNPGKEWMFFLRYQPIKWLSLHMPWPKGILASPKSMNHEISGSKSKGLVKDLVRLKLLIEEMEDFQGVYSTHPMYGLLSPHEWGGLMFKHFDHHLRQFKV